MIRPLVKSVGVRDGIELVEHACIRFGVVYMCTRSQVEPGAAWAAAVRLLRLAASPVPSRVPE